MNFIAGLLTIIFTGYFAITLVLAALVAGAVTLAVVIFYRIACYLFQIRKKGGLVK